MASDFESLLDAMGQVESGGDPNAVSPKGARGTYQIMPATARDYGVNPDDLWNATKSRSLASRIMQGHLTRYGGDVTKALQAYNAGPRRVDSGMIPKETRSYVDKVLGIFSPTSAEASEGDPWSNFKPDTGTSKAYAGTDKVDAGVWGNFKPSAAPTKPDANTAERERLAEVEKRRFAVEGGGTDTYDPMVENLAMAGGSTLMGVPLVAGYAAKTLAGRALTIPLATAEQIMYGWMSDQAELDD